MPAALPPGKTLYPLYMRLVGPQGRSGQVRKISPAPGLDPQTVQPVASRYGLTLSAVLKCVLLLCSCSRARWWLMILAETCGLNLPDHNIV
jgi:hypothetical protein